jgi:hypothetical protein
MPLPREGTQSSVLDNGRYESEIQGLVGLTTDCHLRDLAYAGGSLQIDVHDANLGQRWPQSDVGGSADRESFYGKSI